MKRGANNFIRLGHRPFLDASTRRGLTLFEVVLSLAIFLGSLTALSQLYSTGSRAAVQAQLQSEAILRCNSKLSEVLAGLEELSSLDNANFEDGDENWSWSLHVEQGPYRGLLNVQLTVVYAGKNQSVRTSYSLSRFVRDPESLSDDSTL